MSLGREARPPGMFSAAAAMATMCSGSFATAAALSAPNTAAAPHMSNFISPTEAPDFKLMPPVSKVMPLPISTIGASPASSPR